MNTGHRGRMNRFKQHIPNFVDVDKPEWIAFETTKDLVGLEVVKRYEKRNKLSHFVLSDNCLMVISDDGFYWWVVGYIEDPTTVNLPQWKGPKYMAQMPNGSIVVLTNEVVSSCGNILRLRDGTKVIWKKKEVK